MEWFLAIVGLTAITVVTSLGKQKALNERRRRIELRILKKVYEKSTDHDLREEILVVAQLLIDKDLDILLFNDDDTTAWWKVKIDESDKASIEQVDRLVTLIERNK